MIVVENPVGSVRKSAMETAEKVLKTDPTNIVMSQWQVEERDKEPRYVAFCAVNRRLDPLDTPLMLHMPAQDYEHLKLMFHYVEWLS